MFDKKSDKKNEVAKPPVLFKQTQNLIKEINKNIDGEFLAYYNSNAGNVCGTDSRIIYSILQNKKIKKLNFMITSDGGSGIAALKIINVLRNFCDEISVLIPSNCASAATMMALGGDEIQIGALGYLTAVDTSIRHELSPIDNTNSKVSVSMDELCRVVKLWKENITNNDENAYKSLYSHIHPLVFGAVDRASSLSLKICSEILSYHLKDKEKIEKISHKLNSEFPSHDYPILFKEAKEIGLNVVKMDQKIEILLSELLNMYSEMGQRTFTDYDENSYHDNNIANIVEMQDIQAYYQIDKDWFYRQEERRWNVMNDYSSWRENVFDQKNNIKNSVLYLDY